MIYETARRGGRRRSSRQAAGRRGSAKAVVRPFHRMALLLIQDQAGGGRYALIRGGEQALWQAERAHIPRQHLVAGAADLRCKWRKRAANQQHITFRAVAGEERQV